MRLINHLTRSLENSILTRIRIKNNKIDSASSSKITEYMFKPKYKTIQIYCFDFNKITRLATSITKTSSLTKLSKNSTSTIVAIIVKNNESVSNNNKADKIDKNLVKSKNINKLSKVKKSTKTRYFGTTYSFKL